MLTVERRGRGRRSKVRWAKVALINRHTKADAKEGCNRYDSQNVKGSTDYAKIRC